MLAWPKVGWGGGAIPAPPPILAASQMKMQFVPASQGQNTLIYQISRLDSICVLHLTWPRDTSISFGSHPTLCCTSRGPREVLHTQFDCRMVTKVVVAITWLPVGIVMVIKNIDCLPYAATDIFCRLDQTIIYSFDIKWINCTV